VPTPGGLNVTRMVQEPAAATLAEQSFVSEKTPVLVMLFIVSVAVPVYVNVIDLAGGGQVLLILQVKLRLAGMNSITPLVSVIVAVEIFVVSAAAMALSVTVVLAGRVAGEE
jgi:hypothetical protein